MRDTTEAMCELIPRRIKNYHGPVEPNPNTLRFPLEFRRRRKRRKGKAANQQSIPLEVDLEMSEVLKEKEEKKETL